MRRGRHSSRTRQRGGSWTASRRNQRSILLEFPVELLLHICAFCDIRTLSRFSRTCRVLHQLVEDFAWQDVHRRESAEAPLSSVNSKNWSWRERARHAHQTNLRWVSKNFTPRALNTQWHSKYHSVLAFSRSTLAVAAGNTIYTYSFMHGENKGCGAREDLAIQVHRDPAPATDITGLAFLIDSGVDRQILVTDMSGRIQRIRIQEKGAPFPDGQRRLSGPWYGRSVFATQTARYEHPQEAIKGLSTCKSTALTVSATGRLSIFNTKTPWVSPSMHHLQKKAWTCYLELGASVPFAATGLQTGAFILPVRPNGFGCTNQPILQLEGPGRPCPVYAMGPFLPGASPNIVTSGWYDGKVRVHDLRLPSTPVPARSSSSIATEPASTVPTLAPVLTLSDPWRSFDAIYSVSARGVPSSDDQGSCSTHAHHYITAGSAQHSVIAVWDVRSPRAGWSVYAPGGDRSPVYALITEGSRIWGATQSRAFVLDFAPDMGVRERWPRVEGVERDQSGGFLAAKYSHYSWGVV